MSTYFPCTDCARAIVQTGVKTVATPRPEFDDPVWGESFRTSATILAEGAVEVVFLAEGQDQIHRRIWARGERHAVAAASNSGASIEKGVKRGAAERAHDPGGRHRGLQATRHLALPVLAANDRCRRRPGRIAPDP